MEAREVGRAGLWPFWVDWRTRVASEAGFNVSRGDEDGIRDLNFLSGGDTIGGSGE